MPNPVVHWEIAGKDGTKTQKFYREMFNWDIKVQPQMGDYGMVNAPGGEGIGGGVYTAPMGKPFVTFYVQVDDLKTALDRAVKLGGQAVTQPTPIPGVGAYALMKDIDGNVVGLFKNQ